MISRLGLSESSPGVDTWRKSYFGPYEFLSETVLASLVPMCELQPDLCGGLVVAS